MKRTHDVPTEPGWYWYRPYPAVSWQVVHVYREQGRVGFLYPPRSAHQMAYVIPDNVLATAEWSAERIEEMED